MYLSNIIDRLRIWNRNLKFEKGDFLIDLRFVGWNSRFELYLLEQENIMDIGTQAFSKEELNNIEKTLDPILSNKINSFIDVDEDHICDLITKYLDSNNDINWQDGTGNTLLHKAIYAGYNITTQLLLNKGIHTNISNLNLETALEFAYRLHYKVGAQLIEIYNCNEKLELSESIFEFSMADEDTDLETEENDLILNEPIVESNYPLHLAIKNNQLDKAIQLIENGADVNLRNPLNQTPLHCIMYHYNLQIAKMLIERGADVNAMDNFTQTPLFVLIVLTDDFCNFLDRCKLAHLLITNGADMDFICGWNEINVFDLGKKHFELTSNGEILHFLNHEKDMLNSKDIYLKKIWLSSSWGEYKEFVESMISPSFTQYNDYLFDKNKGVLDVQPIMNKASKRIVQKDGMELQHIEDQTPEICLAAVKQNGLALEFVKEQTDEIILEALKQNHGAYYLIDDNRLRILCNEILYKHNIVTQSVEIFIDQLQKKVSQELQSDSKKETVGLSSKQHPQFINHTQPFKTSEETPATLYKKQCCYCKEEKEQIGWIGKRVFASKDTCWFCKDCSKQFFEVSQDYFCKHSHPHATEEEIENLTTAIRAVKTKEIPIYATSIFVPEISSSDKKEVLGTVKMGTSESSESCKETNETPDREVSIAVDIAINKLRQSIELVNMERIKGLRHYPLRFAIVETLIKYGFDFERSKEIAYEILSSVIKEDTRDLIRESLKTAREYKTDKDFWDYYNRVKDTKVHWLKEESTPMSNASELLKMCEDLSAQVNLSEEEEDRIFEEVDKEISVDRLARLNESIFPGSMIKKSI